MTEVLGLGIGIWDLLMSSSFQMLDEFHLHAVRRLQVDDAVRELIGLRAEQAANAASPERRRWTFLRAAADEVARRIAARVRVGRELVKPHRLEIVDGLVEI